MYTGVAKDRMIDLFNFFYSYWMKSVLLFLWINWVLYAMAMVLVLVLCVVLWSNHSFYVSICLLKTSFPCAECDDATEAHKLLTESQQDVYNGVAYKLLVGSLEH